jgi:transposase
MPQNKDVVGIDVSKRWLDAHLLANGEARRVTNDEVGHRELVTWLRSLDAPVAVLEASGGYEQSVVKSLRQAGTSALVVDPKRVRHYARAMGRLAKNDRIDARLIAEFGAVVTATIRCDIADDPEAREALGALVGARQDLLAHQTALQQQVAASADRRVRRALAAPLNTIAREIARLERMIDEEIAAHPSFAALARRLDTVPGLGPVAIAAIIAWLPELGQLGRCSIAALVGVAPYDDDSGERKGQRYIQGGRTKLRNILYMMAMAASTQHNPVLKAHYAQLMARGKKAKVAIIACLRKLLTILNTMVARQQDWQPKSTTVAA